MCLALLVAGWMAQTAFAQTPDHAARTCATASTASSAVGPFGVGGKHITSAGTLRILLVFVSFPDDETAHPFWPAHSPPLLMRDFIDPDTSTHSAASFNLTQYFRTMSLGKFSLVGDVLWLETGHSQEEYRNGSFGRANTDVLRERVDSLVDFSRYDHWSNTGPFANAEAPDGIVDMIVMVWRTTIFQVFGEASLGYKPGLDVDGIRLEMGFPDNINVPLGSGVTCEYPYADDPQRIMRTMAHEIGHWLLGGPHPYNGLMLSGKHEYWGILCNGHRMSSCANAYERESLGWTTVPEVPADTNIALSDYVTTGASVKFHPVNGDPNEYWYFENHQQLSVFDDVTTNAADKGLWILHQRGPYQEMDNLRVNPSDGNWRWDNPGTSWECYAQQLPVFSQGVPAVRTGQSHRDQIPTQASDVNWLYVYRDLHGVQSCGQFFAGWDFSGSFEFTGAAVFSPYSNPASNTWDNQQTTFALEIVSDTLGTVVVHRPLDPLNAAPARRYLGVDPSLPVDSTGRLALAWGSQWSDGQLLEPNITFSELLRQVGPLGPWEPVYQGPATSWADSTGKYDTTGTIPVQFRVRVRNSRGEFSSWSNIFLSATSRYDAVTAPSGLSQSREESISFGPNYPNPFNPTTAISYQLSTVSDVKLAVYDILGREVAVLVNERKGPGKYDVLFDASGLGSGVYFSRILAGSHSAVMKMLLVR